MTGVSVGADGVEGGFTVDAALIATAFAIDEDRVRACMRAGEMTTKCETGVDADAGRFRLSFRYGSRALRLTVDATGTVLSKASFDVTPRPRAQG